MYNVSMQEGRDKPGKKKKKKQEGIVHFRIERSKHHSYIQTGSRNKYVNYRPVSLTSVICKLLETIIRDHIMEFLINS